MKDATNSLIKTSVFETIKVVESAWTGHNPFAHWLIQNLVPKVLVELGTHNGNSFFAFCQSVLEAGSQTKCYAVDTWEGDEHAGIYDDTVYEEVLRHNQSQYSVFSELIRGTFDSAVDRFEDATIDLLHIDGLHTYEAVRHDFETWSPKVSKKGLILFHDTCVMERDFGVWKLWKELTDELPNHYEFTHAYGLGVLNLDKDHKHPIIEELKEIQKIHGVIFSAFGKHQCNILEIQRRNHEIEALSETVASRDGQIDRLQCQIAEKEGVIVSLNEEVTTREGQILELTARVTDKEVVIAEKDRTISKKDQKINDLENQLLEKKESLAGLSSAVDKLNNSLSCNVLHINGLQGVISEKDREIGVLNEDVACRNQQIAGFRAQIFKMDGAISQKEQDLYHLQAYLDLVKSSRSWRLTAPLRAVQEKMKSVFNTVKRYRLAASITWTHRKTGIFDPEWYLLRYPDVRQSGMNPWWHFALYGVYEGRVPHGATNVVHREYLSGDLSELKGVIPRHLPSEPRMIELDSSENKPVAIVVSGEPDTPGHVFRVRRLVEALELLGYECHQFDAWSAPQSINGTSDVSLLWIWRCEHSSRLLQLVQSARSLGVTVFYDLDDLMLDPELATPKFIDAIRSGKYEAGWVAACYSRIRDLMLCADALSASTRPLAAAMRAHFRPVVEVPNGFDQAMFDAAQKACGRREREAGDNLIRIGYASGTLTHQRDFREAVAGLAACLRRYPRTRLVLFRKNNANMLDPREFPELSGLENQIEWREFVDFGDLPAELARFDINLAPLEHGNPYVEAKSELKYFDAALVRVPTIASPTRPFAMAIQHGVNGLLAATPEEWGEGLSRLVEDDELRQRLAQTAFHHTLAAFGPLAHLRKIERVITMMRGSEAAKALAFRSEVADLNRGWSMPPCSEAEQLFVHFNGSAPEVAIVMPVYNYAGFITEALDSVKDQSVVNLELIIVNDASTDESLDIMLAWVQRNQYRFCRVAVFSNVYNSGLGLSRNRAIAEARARYVLPLDADNKLNPECAATLMRAIRKTPVAFAYPYIQEFGEAYGEMGRQSWHPLLLACCNYIDAMALLDKCAWSDVGGYKAERSGWEDYDFWCRLAEAGYWGIQVTDAMAYYRKHGNSMLRTFTEASDQRARIAASFRQRHRWLDIPGY